MNTKHLKFVLLSKESNSHNLYDQVFNFWHTHWLKAYQEIGVNHALLADDFLRQEEVSALLYDGEPIASILFDWFDLRSIAHLEHSFFKPFSNVEKAQMQNKYGIVRALVFNYLAVDPNWRKQSPSIADLMLGLAVKRFEDSRFSNVIAFCRNTRRANELMHRFGGRTAEKDLLVNNEPSDFGVFSRSSIETAKQSPLDSVIEELYRRGIKEKSINSQFKPNQTKE